MLCRWMTISDVTGVQMEIEPPVSQSPTLVGTILHSLENPQCYVLKLAAWEDVICSCGSDLLIKLYKLDSSCRTAAFMCGLQGHTSRITDAFISQNSVFSSSEDKTIRAWDLRMGSECTRIGTAAEVWSVDACLDRGIVAGGVGPEIHLWDLRNVQFPMSVLSDSHNDDVTRVSFHGEKQTSNLFLSGSLDGLLCIYDLQPVLNGELEENCLEAVMNANSPVSSAGIFGSAGGLCLFSTTTDHGLAVWQLPDPVPRFSFSDYRPFIAVHSPTSASSMDYLIACHGDLLSGNLEIMGGNDDGTLASGVVLLTDGRLSGPPAMFPPGGHLTRVDSCVWVKEGLIATGGEDSRICLWSKSQLPRRSPSTSNTTDNVGPIKIAKRRYHDTSPYSISSSANIDATR